MASPIAVTISRQFGAGGALIGRRVAQELGFHYFDQEIVGQVATRLHQEKQLLASRDERLSSFWEDFLRVFSVGTPEAAYPPPEIRRYCSDRELFSLEAEVILEVASRQNTVIVGRGGFWILKKHPGLISIFLHADRTIRAATIRDHYKLTSDRKAFDMVDEYDRNRERFLKTMTGEVWLSASNYHLCIDTGHVGMSAAREFIVHFINKVQQ